MSILFGNQQSIRAELPGQARDITLIMPEGLSTSDDHIALKHGIIYIHAAGVIGDVAEFGCFTGRSAALLACVMASLLDHHNRKLWLFDSFQGMPVPTDEVDINSPQIGAWAWSANVDAQKVTDICAQPLGRDRVKVFPGWFESTLPSIPPEASFALVHVDCDLYLSAFQVLDHLFRHRHLADGAMIFFDDWYCNRGRPDCGEQKAWDDMKKKNFYGSYSFTDYGPYGMVGHRFIVHRTDE